MVIHEMNREECFRLLAGARIARLGCVCENQPYVVPVYLAYDSSDGEACLYGFTTVGQKVKWMRANPLVCVEVDEVTSDDQWVSVIAFGRYEELPPTVGSDAAHLKAPERPRQVGEAILGEPAGSHHGPTDRDGLDDNEWERARQVLQAHSAWWEPGCTVWAARAPQYGRPFCSGLLPDLGRPRHGSRGESGRTVISDSSPARSGTGLAAPDAHARVRQWANGDRPSQLN
jgi:hypothetical protein